MKEINRSQQDKALLYDPLPCRHTKALIKAEKGKFNDSLKVSGPLPHFYCASPWQWVCWILCSAPSPSLAPSFLFFLYPSNLSLSRSLTRCLAFSPSRVKWVTGFPLKLCVVQYTHLGKLTHTHICTRVNWVGSVIVDQHSLQSVWEAEGVETACLNVRERDLISLAMISP